MGMPITISIPDGDGASRGMETSSLDAANEVFEYFRHVDARFSPYKADSEVSRIDRGELRVEDSSADMQEIVRLSEDTRRLTDGFFDIRFNGRFDPSGLVKGWSIRRAALLLDEMGFRNYCVDAGGDMQVSGCEAGSNPWRIGLRNPFDPETIIRVVAISDRGIATSGTYIRGDHIYNPVSGERAKGIASMTVVAPNVYEADRLATAAFAMGLEGIEFIASIPTCEGYMVDHDGIATFTNGFARYITT
jgi:thiamine biosynthesis lipoprotein